MPSWVVQEERTPAYKTRHSRDREGMLSQLGCPGGVQGRRLQEAAHTHLLRNAASSTTSICFICVPRSRVMLSALAWPWEMICRGEMAS